MGVTSHADKIFATVKTKSLIASSRARPNARPGGAPVTGIPNADPLDQRRARYSAPKAPPSPQLCGNAEVHSRQMVIDHLSAY